MSPCLTEMADNIIRLIVCCQLTQSVMSVFLLICSSSVIHFLFLFYSQAHPGTEVTVIDLYDNLASLSPLWRQVQSFRKAIDSIMQKAPGGIHLLCFSQGPLSHSHTLA